MMLHYISFAAVYFSEAVIALQYYEHLFTKKFSSISTFWRFVLGYVLLFCVWMIDITPVNTISFFCVNWLLSWECFYCAPKTAALHSAFLSFIMTIAEVFTALLLSAFTGDFSSYTQSFSVLVPMLIVSKLVYYFFSIIGARVFSSHKERNEEPNMMVLFCSLPIISASISVLVACLSLENDWSQDAELIIVITLLSFLIANLIFFTLYNYQQKVNAEFTTLQLSKQKEEADTAYYETLRGQAESQRILIHDIKNHLQIIDGLAQEKQNTDIAAYVENLVESLTPHKEHPLCNDPILSLILSRYAEECKIKAVDFICDVRNNCTSFMDAPSITTFYGNLLSNAVEAAELSQEKYVEISVVFHHEQEIILVSVNNSCDISPIPSSNGLFETTKTLPGIHGVGLRGIRRVIKKYDGIETMQYDVENKRFHHIVQFSIKK